MVKLTTLMSTSLQLTRVSKRWELPESRSLSQVAIKEQVSKVCGDAKSSTLTGLHPVLISPLLEAPIPREESRAAGMEVEAVSLLHHLTLDLLGKKPVRKLT